MLKKALITGITGQDGGYLSEFLLNEGYEVHGIIRRNSSQEFYRLNELKIFNRVKLHEIELTEKYQLEDFLRKNSFDEIYNLAAQSFVGTSFSSPFYSLDVNTYAVLNMLECLRRYQPEAKFYQASTSEMFGKVQETPQNERTPFYPRSPYGVSKLASHWLCINYRESYDMFISSGILFNHESPYRGYEFVTKKISSTVARIKHGSSEKILLGNLNASRDWGYAGDYVKAMYLLLQKEKPIDIVIGTGKTISIREFVEKCFSYIDINIIWEGNGLDERGICSKTNKSLVEISKQFFRPAEVELLVADPRRAKYELNWEPKVNIDGLVSMMMEYDLRKEL